MATKTLGELRAELRLDSRYDATGAKAFQADILKMQTQTRNVEAAIGDIVRRVRELQTAGKAVDILPDLDREAMDLVAVLNQMADQYSRTLKDLAGRKVIAPEQFRNVQAFTADIRQLADSIDLLEGHSRTEAGGYQWNPSGQAKRMAEVFQGAVGDTSRFLSTLTHAYVELDRLHTQHFERMSQRTEAVAREQQQLSRIMGRGEGFQMTLSAVTRLTDNLGRLELGLQNVAVDYARLQREISVASSDAPDALSPVKIRAASEAIVDALKVQKTKVKELLADPGLDKLFDGEMMRASLTGAVQAIDRQIGALKGSLDFVPAISFLGKDFQATIEVINAGTRKGSGILRDFAAATAQSSKVIDGSFETIEQSAVEAAKSLRHFPGLEGVFEINALNNAGAKFSQALNAMVRLRKEFNSLQADFKGEAFGALSSSDAGGFTSRFKELQVGVTATGALLKQLHANPSLAALFPPEALDIVRRMQKEVDELNSRLHNPARQKAGTFLDAGLNESAYVGAIGAVRAAIGNVEIAMQGAGQEARTLSVNMDTALQMMESGRILNSVKAFRSLNLAMQAIDQGAKTAAAGLPAILDKLALFNDKQLAEMANPRNRFTGDDAFERYQKRFTKNYGATLALIKDYQTEMAGLDAALKRFIDTGEQFGIVKVEDLARAREYRDLIATLKDATPADLAQLDATAVARRSRDTLGANRQHLRDNAAQLRAASAELQTNLQLVRGLAEAGEYLDDGPAAATEKMRSLTAASQETTGVIERLREKTRQNAQAIEAGETAMADLAQAAHKAQAAGTAAAASQARLAATTAAAGAATTDLGEDISLVNARLRETETVTQSSGSRLREGATEADRLAQEFIDMGRAAGGAGDDLITLGGRVRDLSEPIRVTEVRFDELLNQLKAGASFKELNQRFEESARRIIEEQQAIRDLTGTYGRYVREQVKAGSGSDRFERALKGVGATVLALNGDMREAHMAMSRYAQAWREISTQRTLFSRGAGLLQAVFPAGDETRLAGLRDRLLGVTDRLHDWRTEMKLVRAGVAETESKVYKALGVLGKLKANIVEGLFHGVGYELTNALQMAAMAVKQFIKDSTQAHMDFSRGVAEIYTIIPDASHYMRQRIADDISAISMSFGYLQGEVLPAAYQALSLGVEAPDVTTAVESAAMAARASVSELAPTLETGQSLVNAYGGEIYDLSEIYDLLFFAIKNGSITMRDINNQMAPITAVAGEVGVAFEDIVAAMVVMSRQGDDMGTISKMLSNMLTQIQIETTALGGAFKEAAGVGFRQFIDDGGTLVEAMELISAGVRKTGISITESVGGDSPFFRDQQAMLAVLELTGKHLDDLKAAAGGAADAGGSMSQAFAEVESTLWMVDQRSKATTEEMKRQIGEALEPATRSWLEFKLAVAEGFANPFRRDSLLADMREFGEATRFTIEQYRELAYYIQRDVPEEGGNVITEAFKWADDNNSLNLLKGLSVAYEEYGHHARDANEQNLRARVINYLLASGFRGTTAELQRMTESIARQVEYSRMFADPTSVGSMQGLKGVADHYREYAQEIQDIFKYELGDDVDFAADAKKRSDEMYKASLAYASQEAAKDWAKQHQEALQDEMGRFTALDGDSFDIELMGVVTKVRLNNVDTAEIVHGAGGRNMAYGQAAFELSQDFVLTGDMKLSQSYGESYERQLRNLFNEAGDSLEKELVQAGLAVPIDFEFRGDREFAQELQALAMQAARQGIGVFRNNLVRDMYIEGSITSMEQISGIYESITEHYGQTLEFAQSMETALQAVQKADGEWVDGHVNNAGRIAAIQAQLAGDLTKEQRSALDAQLKGLEEFTDEYDAVARQIGADLTDNKRGDLLAELEALQAGQGISTKVFTGDPKELDEARQKVAELREEVEQYFKTLAYQSFMDYQGGITAEVVDLGVQLGIFSREAGDQALRMAEIATAIERIGRSADFAAMNVGDQGSVIDLIIGGWATTAEEAIMRLENLKTERDRVLESFVSGGGTAIYWDMAAGAAESMPTYELAIDAALSPEFNTAMADATTRLQTLKEEKYEATLSINPGPFNDEYDILSGKITEYETADPILLFDTEHIAAEAVMDRLLEKAKDKVVTYTYNVKVNGKEPSVDGEYASGGPISPGTWLVGEEGPELISLNGYGNVINNENLRKMLGRGGGAPQIVVNIDARGIESQNLHWLQRKTENGIVKALQAAGYRPR